MGGQCAAFLDNLWAAAEALEIALDEAEPGNITGRARYVYGEVLRRLGEPHRAIQQFSIWIEQLDTHYPELRPLLLGDVLFNQALAFRQVKRYEEAMDGYVAACDEFRKEGMRTYLCMALQNLAWVASIFGDSVAARLALDEARPLCATLELRWHQKLGEAFLQSLEGYEFQGTKEPALRRALELCEVLIQHSGEDLPMTVRSHAFWLAGTISMDLGRPNDAEDFALQALDLSSKAGNETRCLYDAADLLSRVRQHLEQHKPAEA